MQLTNPPGHLWRDKWTALSGPLSSGDRHEAMLARAAMAMANLTGSVTVVDQVQPCDCLRAM